MSASCDKASALLDRLYGRMLAFYPAEFRYEYGAEMVEFFREDCRRAARRGGLPGLLSLGLRTLADLAFTASGAHMETLIQDLRFAVRMGRSAPAFALAAILALALGIGANSAIFSLVHGILLAPLPFPEAGRLVMLWEKNPRGIERNSVSPPNFLDYRAGSQSFSGMAAFYEEGAHLTGSGEAERVLTSAVSPGFFEVLGVSPLVGRGLGAGPSEVVLSYGIWQRRFGQDPAIIGKTLRIDDRGYVVRGVMPPDFRLSSPRVELWTTFPFDPARFSRQAHFLSIVARLKPRTTPAQARAGLESIAARLARSYPASNRGWGVTLVPLKEEVVGKVRASLLLLLGAVGLVLLIACANVANLLLARGTHRRAEIAIRTALGADSGRIVRQMLTESVLLAFAGGVAGLALCLGAVALLKASRPAAIPRLDELAVNGWVMAFAFALALLSGVASGLAPALRACRPDFLEDLKDGMARPGGFAGRRLRGALIAAEVALSLLLMLGAGLLIRSFVRLQGLDPGFNSARALTFDLDLPAPRYAAAPSRAAFLQEAVERVRALHGVDAAGMISNLPLTGGEGFNRFGFKIEHDDRGAAGGDRFYARWITPGYLRGMGIPLLSGRDFTSRDREGSAAVAIIDAALARRYFPHGDPIGKYVRLSYAASVPREIVGVAGEVRLVALETEPAPQIYIPVLQETRPLTMSLVVRGSREGADLAAAVPAELHRLDPDVPVYDIQPLARRVAESLAPRRLNMLLMSLLAALALVLAAVGVYGVISYVVGERLPEIGVRMALGARPREILLLVLRQGMRHALSGIAMGLAAALLLTRALTGLLYGVSPLDRRTFAVSAFLTALVALLACLIPAFRAATVDPVSALRSRWNLRSGPA